MEFEQVLEQCLGDLESGASTVDGCLKRHPEYAAQLQPVLLIAATLEQGRALEPSPAFKARGRAKLTLHMQAHPRRSASSGFSFWRLAASLAILMLALLATGTAYAQRALPGDLFYDWKLLSERAWRAVSPDPVRTDLVIANRRIDEMNAVANDPIRSALALAGYQEVLTRLQSELDVETLQQLLPDIEVEQTPIVTPEQIIPTLPLNPPGPNGIQPTLPSLPETIATEVPEIIPTIEVSSQPNGIQTTLPSLPEAIATAAPEIIPTIEIPPVLP